MGNKLEVIGANLVPDTPASFSSAPQQIAPVSALDNAKAAKKYDDNKFDKLFSWETPKAVLEGMPTMGILNVVADKVSPYIPEVKISDTLSFGGQAPLITNSQPVTDERLEQYAKSMNVPEEYWQDLRSSEDMTEVYTKTGRILSDIKGQQHLAQVYGSTALTMGSVFFDPTFYLGNEAGNLMAASVKSASIAKSLAAVGALKQTKAATQVAEAVSSMGKALPAQASTVAGKAASVAEAAAGKSGGFLVDTINYSGTNVLLGELDANVRGRETTPTEFYMNALVGAVAPHVVGALGKTYTASNAWLHNRTVKALNEIGAKSAQEKFQVEPTDKLNEMTIGEKVSHGDESIEPRLADTGPAQGELFDATGPHPKDPQLDSMVRTLIGDEPVMTEGVAPEGQLELDFLGEPKRVPVETPEVAPVVETTPVAEAEPVASPDVPTEIETPKELLRARPSYTLDGVRFTPRFKSTVDKALFIVGQDARSAHDVKYMEMLRQVFPKLSDAEIREAGQGLKAQHMRGNAKVAIETKGLPRGSESELPVETTWQEGVNAVGKDHEPVFHEVGPSVPREGLQPEQLKELEAATPEVQQQVVQKAVEQKDIEKAQRIADFKEKYTDDALADILKYPKETPKEAGRKFFEEIVAHEKEQWAHRLDYPKDALEGPLWSINQIDDKKFSLLVRGTRSKNVRTLDEAKAIVRERLEVMPEPSLGQYSAGIKERAKTFEKDMAEFEAGYREAFGKEPQYGVTAHKAPEPTAEASLNVNSIDQARVSEPSYIQSVLRKFVQDTGAALSKGTGHTLNFKSKDGSTQDFSLFDDPAMNLDLFRSMGKKGITEWSLKETGGGLLKDPMGSFKDPFNDATKSGDTASQQVFVQKAVEQKAEANKTHPALIDFPSLGVEQKVRDGALFKEKAHLIKGLDKAVGDQATLGSLGLYFKFNKPTPIKYSFEEGGKVIEATGELRSIQRGSIADYDGELTVKVQMLQEGYSRAQWVDLPIEDVMRALKAEPIAYTPTVGGAAKGAPKVEATTATKTPSDGTPTSGAYITEKVLESSQRRTIITEAQSVKDIRKAFADFQNHLADHVMEVRGRFYPKDASADLGNGQTFVYDHSLNIKKGYASAGQLIKKMQEMTLPESDSALWASVVQKKVSGMDSHFEVRYAEAPKGNQAGFITPGVALGLLAGSGLGVYVLGQVAQGKDLKETLGESLSALGSIAIIGMTKGNKSVVEALAHGKTLADVVKLPEVKANPEAVTLKTAQGQNLKLIDLAAKTGRLTDGTPFHMGTIKLPFFGKTRVSDPSGEISAEIRNSDSETGRSLGNLIAGSIAGHKTKGAMNHTTADVYAQSTAKSSIHAVGDAFDKGFIAWANRDGKVSPDFIKAYSKKLVTEFNDQVVRAKKGETEGVHPEAIKAAKAIADSEARLLQMTADLHKEGKARGVIAEGSAWDLAGQIVASPTYVHRSASSKGLYELTASVGLEKVHLLIQRALQKGNPELSPQFAAEMAPAYAKTLASLEHSSGLKVNDMNPDELLQHIKDVTQLTPEKAQELSKLFMGHQASDGVSGVLKKRTQLDDTFEMPTTDLQGNPVTISMRQLFNQDIRMNHAHWVDSVSGVLGMARVSLDAGVDLTHGATFQRLLDQMKGELLEKSVPYNRAMKQVDTIRDLHAKILGKQNAEGIFKPANEAIRLLNDTTTLLSHAGFVFSAGAELAAAVQRRGLEAALNDMPELGQVVKAALGGEIDDGLARSLITAHALGDHQTAAMQLGLEQGNLSGASGAVQTAIGQTAKMNLFSTATASTKYLAIKAALQELSDVARGVRTLTPEQWNHFKLRGMSQELLEEIKPALLKATAVDEKGMLLTDGSGYRPLDMFKDNAKAAMDLHAHLERQGNAAASESSGAGETNRYMHNDIGRTLGKFQGTPLIMTAKLKGNLNNFDASVAASWITTSLGAALAYIMSTYVSNHGDPETMKKKLTTKEIAKAAFRNGFSGIAPNVIDLAATMTGQEAPFAGVTNSGRKGGVDVPAFRTIQRVKDTAATVGHALTGQQVTRAEAAQAVKTPLWALNAFIPFATAPLPKKREQAKQP